MSRSPLLLAITWLITCVAVLTAGLAMRLAPVETTVAWPTLTSWQGATSFTSPAALILAVVAGVLLFLLSGSAKEGGRARPFAELLVLFPVIFAFVWLLLPTGKPNAITIVMGLILTAVSWYLLRHSPGPLTHKPWNRKKSTIVLDAALVLLPVVAGLALGSSPDLKAGGLSLLLYPIYAFIQLGLFLYIPVTRLRAMGVSNENSTLLTALLFSLIHWPNPLVMLITLAGMLIWAHQFQNGRRMWQLALVMGLTATTFSQFLPDDLTRHMRVGPGYVRSEATTILADNSPILNLVEYLEFAYPQTMGRPPLPEEIQTWEKLVTDARPSTWAYMFLTSSESRKRLASAGGEQPPPDSMHWTAWPKEWKSRVESYASPEYWEKSGSSLDGLVRALYVDILSRGASPQELNSWTTNLTTNQKRRISEELLDHQLQQGQAVFTGMEMEEFRFPN